MNIKFLMQYFIVPLFLLICVIVHATDWQVEAGKMCKKDYVVRKDCKARVAELSERMAKAGQAHYIVSGTRYLEPHRWIELPSGEIIEPSHWCDAKDLYHANSRMLIVGAE